MKKLLKNSLEIALEYLQEYYSFPGIPQIIELLEQSLALKEVKLDHLTKPRRMLLNIMSAESKGMSYQSNTQPLALLFKSNLEPINTYDVFFKLVHKILLILAQAAPLNEFDPISLEKIQKSNKIYTSEGYVFDINTLIKFHNKKIIYDCYGNIDETEPRYLVNVNTNLVFSKRDKEHIEAVILKRIPGITVRKYRQLKEAYKKQSAESVLVFALFSCCSTFFCQQDLNLALRKISGIFFLTCLYHVTRLYLNTPIDALEGEALLDYPFACDETTLSP